MTVVDGVPAGSAGTAADRVDIAHPRTYLAGVPHSEFARRRREAPVAWTPEPLLVRHTGAGRTEERGSGFWAVTTHAAVREAARRPEDFSSEARGAFLRDPRTGAELRRARSMLLNTDGARHTRVRKLAAAVFTPRAVSGLAAGVRAHATALVARACAAGEFDVVDDLAARMSVLVLADLLGVPPADHPLLVRWSDQLVGFDDPEYGGGDVVAYARTMVDAFDYASEVAAQRRRDGRDDLVGRLATAEVDGVRLSDREFRHFWLLLVVAGNETSRHLVSGAVQALAGNPAERDRFVDGSVTTATAVEELLRWVSPFVQFRRTATRDVVLAGRSIAAGDKVVLYHASANRDESVFARADRLDLGRDPNPHLAFGSGPHFCLGAHLARLELAAVLEALRADLPRLRLTGPARRLESNFVNGIVSLPARLG